MSDNDFDKVLAGLRDEPTPAPEAPVKAKRPRPKAKTAGTPAEAPKTAVSGPRADPEFDQINANIPRELKMTAFFYAKSEGLTLSSLIHKLLKEYVDERGGVLPMPRVKRRKR